MFPIRNFQKTSDVRFFTRPKLKSKNVSKMLKFTFGFVLATLSLDFGFIKFKSSRISILVKSLCALQTIGISFVFLYFYCFTLDNNIFIYWFLSYVLEYAIIVFILLFTKNSTFFDFWTDLWFFDVELGIETSNKVEYLIIFGIISCFVRRTLFTVIYCAFFVTYCIGDIFYTSLFFIPLLCGDVFLFIYFVIYYLLYNRLKFFTLAVGKGYFDIIVSQYLYKSLVDIADNIKSIYNPLYLAPLFFHTVHMMITVFYPLIINDIGEVGSVVSMVNVSVVHVFIMLFLPAYAAGLLSSQVEKLKIVLHERLLQERDRMHVSDIERFIRYIDARHLKTTILKVIPLDWHLPVIVFNLSVTYLIVMLQFTHKY